jgi:molybdopterin converting factor small subunit
MGESFKVKLDKETVLGVIEKLGIPFEKGVIVMVNSNRITDLNQKLNSEDVVVIFPLLGGG